MTSYAVIWSPKAKLTYLQILEYLDEECTAKELDAFISRTEQVIGYISNNPLLFHIQWKMVPTNVCSPNR